MTSKARLSLANRTILVTRPVEQARKLCMLIEAADGRALMLPTIKIVAATAVDILQSNDLFSRFDRFIFISRSAVSCALKTMGTVPIERWGANTIFALGAGTAAELKKHGLSAVSHAGPNASSEALLDMPAFAASNINGSRVLLIKGDGGRSVLQDELSRRGAEVTIADVYKRSIPQYNKIYIWWQWQRYKPDTIVVTSNEGLENLVKLTPKIMHAHIFNSILIVLGRRTAALARRCGFINRIIITRSTSNVGLLRALYRLNETKDV